MEDCLFCKKTKKESPSITIYEDEEFVAFLAMESLNKGHSFVIPKKHYRWVWDSPNIGAYFEVAQKVVCGLRKACNTDFVIGVALGNEIPHANVQLIPRYEHDGHGDSINPALVHTLSIEEMRETVELIKKSISK